MSTVSRHREVPCRTVAERIETYLKDEVMSQCVINQIFIDLNHIRLV